MINTVFSVIPSNQCLQVFVGIQNRRKIRFARKFGIISRKQRDGGLGFRDILSFNDSSCEKSWRTLTQ